MTSLREPRRLSTAEDTEDAEGTFIFSSVSSVSSVVESFVACATRGPR